MARFNIFHYLFAVLVALVLVANARPTSSEPDTGSVAGMPGMAAELQGGSKPQGNTEDREAMANSQAQYMDDMEQALEAASKAVAQATPTTAGARPTPGVPTTVPSQPSATKPAVPAGPSASAPSAKPKGVLDSLPLVGGLVQGLPLPI